MHRSKLILASLGAILTGGLAGASESTAPAVEGSPSRAIPTAWSSFHWGEVTPRTKKPAAGGPQPALGIHR